MGKDRNIALSTDCLSDFPASGCLIGEMQDMHDAQLLRDYAEHGIEAAFSEIVARYTDLVFSAALRQVSAPDLAGDVAQDVFRALASKASPLANQLAGGGSLVGWLYRSTRFAALNHLRDDRRRLAHEKQAMEQLATNAETAPDWDRLRPVLDEAMADLNDEDRAALLLRFFKKHDLHAVGAALGVSDDTAQKRVSRALEKLRQQLARRGITSPATALSAVIMANAVQAAPAGLAGSVAGTALASTAARGSAEILTARPMEMMTWARIKSGVALGVAALAVTVAVLFTMEWKSSPLPVSHASNLPPPATSSYPAPIAATNSNYTLRELSPAPGFNSIHVLALNNQGQVVGGMDSTNNETHAFVWDNGVLTDLGTLGGSKSSATGINDAGDIVGTILTNSDRRAFLLHNGEVTDLGRIDGYPKLGAEGNTYYSPCIAINGLSQVVGHVAAGNENPRPFILNQGRTAYFGLLTSASIFYAEIINRRGQILGRATPTQGDTRMHSMRWQDGEMIDLSALNGTLSTANGMNDRGTVVGVATIPTNGRQRAFIWENGSLRWLNTSNSVESSGLAIDNTGLVVGFARTPKKRYFACLWKGDEMLDLSSLVSIESGWQLVSAEAVNDRGQIMARAANDKMEQRYFLISPWKLPLPTPVQPALLENSVALITPFNLTSFERLPDGAFRLGFAGSPDRNYVVEASTNLVTWTLLGAATNDGGKVEFTDTDAAKYTLRFYRALRVP